MRMYLLKPAQFAALFALAKNIREHGNLSTNTGISCPGIRASAKHSQRWLLKALTIPIAVKLLAWWRNYWDGFDEATRPHISK